MVRLDEIGYWSEIKLDIIKKYASAYSQILNNQAHIHEYHYIDAFAGAGIHLSKETKEDIPGSPVNALHVEPSFTKYHFIDLNGDKVQLLQELSSNYSNVDVHQGDCNTILLDTIFPLIQYENYNRALCLLDPYGLHLDWNVIFQAGQSRAIEIFLNFPVMDMNMNILWNKPDNVNPKQIDRMNMFWGDSSWKNAAYRPVRGLFDTIEEKAGNNAIAQAFQLRLKEVAGFQYVATPLPMRNTKGAVVYYLVFASPNKTGHKIIEDIFNRYKDRGLI